MQKARTSNKTVGFVNSSGLRLLLKLGLGLGLLAVILYFVDLHELVEVAAGVNAWYLVAILALIFLDRAVMAYKWGLLLRAAGLPVSFSLLLRSYLIAPLAGALLPSTVGADIFRVYILGRYGIDRHAVLASIVAERVIGFAAMLALVTMSLGLALYLLRDLWDHLREIALVLAAGGGLAAVLIAVTLRRFQRFADVAAERLSRYPGVSKLHQVYSLYAEYRKRPRTVGIVSAWTFLEQLVPILSLFLLAHALDVDISLLEMTAIVPVIVLVARLPISLDGLGVSEGLSVVMFGLVGVSPAEALLMAAFGRALQYLPGLPWAIHYLFGSRRERLVADQQAPEAAVTTHGT